LQAPETQVAPVVVLHEAGVVQFEFLQHCPLGMQVLLRSQYVFPAGHAQVPPSVLQTLPPEQVAACVVQHVPFMTHAPLQR